MREEYKPLLRRGRPITGDIPEPVEETPEKIEVSEGDELDGMKEPTAELQAVWRWNAVVNALEGLEKIWNIHLEGLQEIESTDFLPEDLQRHLAQIFTHAEFYIAVPQLVDYIRVVGGIDNLFVKEVKEDNARTD